MDELVNESDDVFIPLNKQLPFWSVEFWECMSHTLDSSRFHGSKNAFLLFLSDKIIELFPKHFHTSCAIDSAATLGAAYSLQHSFNTAAFCADLTLAALEYDPSEVND